MSTKLGTAVGIISVLCLITSVVLVLSRNRSASLPVAISSHPTVVPQAVTPSQQLVGRWVSADQTQGGYVFNAEGTGTTIPGNAVDAGGNQAYRFNWSLNGTDLQLTNYALPNADISAGAARFEFGCNLAPDGNTLTIDPTPTSQNSGINTATVFVYHRQ